jgi:U3 small nucleolar RNA-associated protein 14
MSTTDKQNSSKKSKSKSKKDERYEDMLKKIDLGLDKEKPTNLAHDSAFDNDNEDSSRNLKPGAVSIFDLMSSLENTDKVAPNDSMLKTHITEMTKKNVFEEAPATWKQEEMDRKANYDIIKKDAKKWEGIIKRNREAPHLDLTNKNNDKFRINSNIVHNLSKSNVETRVEAKLKELNLLNEEDFLKEERDMLKKLNPDEAKRREAELTKHRNLMFYQELKQKRISKIKSKLYHKIKNKREKKLQERLMSNLDESDPMAQLREIEELEKKRAQVRLHSIMILSVFYRKEFH